jgi:mono/diheme cytochrome c family protein
VRAPLVLFTLLPLGAQTILTPEQQRGQQLYERGTSASGTAVSASIGPGAPVAGSVLPCANCHGLDGLGRAEGGIVPANVTWDALTKPYGVQRADGRTRPPYTDRSVKRAITMGLDPDGKALHKAMPRYTLTLADASDLVAYLKVVGRLSDPGLTETSVRIGVILPPGNDGTVMREALSRHFAQVNRLGGVFGRTIELEPIERTRMDSVFAVCGAFSGSEREIADAARRTGAPAIAILAEAPDLREPLNSYVFYLDSGGGLSGDRGRQIWDRSVAAAEIFVEGMKRAGRSLTRHSLIEAIERFSLVGTSLPEPISFGPSRRVGIADQK